MNSITMLTKVMAAGALLLMQPNKFERLQSRSHAEQAYLDLRGMIKEKFPQVDVDILDLGPGSVERQQIMAENLEKASVIEDEEILEQAQVVLYYIQKEEPSILWAVEPADEPAHLK